MGKAKPLVSAWIAAVTATATAIAIAIAVGAPWVSRTAGISTGDWLALALLTTSAAIANLFPIRTAANGATYRLNNVFILAGALVLPKELLALQVVLALAPDLWARRHRPRILVEWLFNTSQTTLAAYAAGAWSHTVHTSAGLSESVGVFSRAVDLAAFLGAAALFTLAQAVLVGVIIALDRRIPFTSVPTLALPALLSDGLGSVLGVVVAGLWHARPELLVLVPVVLIIAHRMTRTAHLAHLAQVDAKTGLHNSRHFEQALQEELAHSLRVKRPVSLLFIDLDHFKQVNDRYGHAAGDHVLRELSTLLSGIVRKGDLVARFGGEEFVALLPGTEGNEAAFLGERIRSAVEAHEIAIEGHGSIRCTVSVGVASCPENATVFSALIEQADAAMYRAKRTRNAVARAEGMQTASTAMPALPPASTGEPDRPAQLARAKAASVVDQAASRLAPWMLWGTVVGGTLVTAASGWMVSAAGGWVALVPFVAFAVLAEFLQIDVVQAGRQKMSLSFTIVAILAGATVHPMGAPLVALASAATHVLLKQQRQVSKAAFNLANLPLAAAAAAALYQGLTPGDSAFTVWNLVVASAAVIAYYLVNVGIISLMISLHTGRSLGSVARVSAWSAPTNILLGLTGAFLGGAHTQLGVVGIAMFAVPILVMRFTLSFYAKETQKHIESIEAAKTEAVEAHNEKEEMLRKLIETVALIIDARDNSVSGHSRRVASFSVAIGRELGLNAEKLALLHTAGLFHDLGKVGIPEAILHKPSRLSADEYTVIKEHAALGERILSEVPQLAEIAQMVGEHHERFDGVGYPKGLAAEQISVGGRILVVADALETMLADRPYSKGRDLSEALEELDRCAGGHFDPDVVTAVHRAVAKQGELFFTGTERRVEGKWGTAEQILAQVFA